MHIDRQIAIWAGWIAGPAFGIAMMAAPEYLHLKENLAALLFWGGIIVFAVTVFIVVALSAREQEQRRKPMWPIIAMAVGSIIFGVGVAGYFWPSSQIEAGGAVKQSSSQTAYGLLRKYPSEVDREALRAIFRDISALVNDEVSPAQLDVHKLLDIIPQKIGEPAAEAGIKRFAEIRVQFEKIRNDLYAKYVNGKYYANEAWDILGNTDALYSEMNALDQYLELARVVQSGDSKKLVRALVEPRKALEKANGDLGNWVGECLKRIQTKRDALDR